MKATQEEIERVIESYLLRSANIDKFYAEIYARSIAPALLEKFNIESKEQ